MSGDIVVFLKDFAGYKKGDETDQIKGVIRANLFRRGIIKAKSKRQTKKD